MSEYKEILPEEIETKEQKKIIEFLKGSQKAFRICQAKTEKGMAFYASNPKSRYPWIYTRDLACIGNSFLELGDYKTAKECIEFLASCETDHGRWFQRYNEKGESKEAKFEEDGASLGLWFILSYIEKSGDKEFAKKIEPRLREAVFWIENYNQKHLEKFDLVYTTASIHEAFDLRNIKKHINQGYEIWNNSVTIKALETMSRIYPESHYQDLVERIKTGIKKYLIKNGRFIRRLTEKGEIDLSPDMMLLSPAYFDLFKENEILDGKHSYKEILKNTINELYQKLWDKKLGGFMRLPDYEFKEKNPNYQGVISPILEGPWILYTAWMAQIQFKLGRSDEGKKLIYWCLSQAKQGMLSEHLVDSEIFLKHKEKEVEYHKKTKTGQSLETSLRNLEIMTKQAKTERKLDYAWPLVWSQAEVLKALKMANLIREFKYEEKT